MATRPAIAFLLPNLDGGGAERVALTLIQDFVRRGLKVEVVLLNAVGALLPLLPDRVDVIDLRARRIRSGILPLVRYFRRNRPDAVHVSMWPLTSIAVLAHRLARARSRLILTDHTTLTTHFGHYGSLRRRLMRTIIRRTYPRANERIVVSHGAAADLAALSGLPRSSLEVVYNPVAAPPASGTIRPDIEALWGEGHRLITVGSMKAEKNHQLLIRSFAQAFPEGDASLMIVGEGPLRGELEAAAARAGVAGRVRMPGFSPDPWPFYRSAHLFVLSSDYEGYPLVLVEALRSGLRIISTDCESGPREILADGQYGTLVPVRNVDAMAAALRHAFDRPFDPAPGQARAESLSGQGVTDRYFELVLGRDPNSTRPTPDFSPPDG